MARMKDIKYKCENKFNSLKEKFKLDKTGDQPLNLPYDTSQILLNATVTKEFCSEIKRIGSFGFVTYSINEDEKKSKKKTLSSLAELFNDTSSKLNEKDPKRGPLNFGALAFVEMKEFTDSFYRQMENNVIEPLYNLEKICAEVQDLDKRVHSLKKEIANLKTKFEEQVTIDEQKSQLMKDQITNAQSDCDNLIELYLQKVFTYEATAFQYAEILQDVILLRAEYHEKCVKSLMKTIPKCNSHIEEKRLPLAFGTPLENHLRETKRFIAYPLEFCVKNLSDVHQLQQEGLFRVSGSMNKANLLCSILNLMKYDEVDIEWPPHVLADALKRYLREMPVSLLGKIIHSEWEACHEKFKSGHKQASYQRIKELLGQLPKSYYQNLEYLIRFLNLVIREKSHNLMGIQNICMVFVPNLFKSSVSDSISISGLNIENNVYFNYILESLLQDTNYFFPHTDQIDNPLPSIEFKKSKTLSPLKDKDNVSTEKIDEKMKRSNSAIDRYSKVVCNENNNDGESVVLTRSQLRRKELQNNPLNFEIFESEFTDISLKKNNLGSPTRVPPVPPRLKLRKE